jgi:molybdopterin/thiamine biosynthesis adenylyltransferase
MAGDIWLPGGRRVEIADASIVGRRLRRIAPATRRLTVWTDPGYDRQVGLFGDAGQEILRGARVAIIGLGGVGSLLAQYLAHLGVGHFILIDPDRVEITNLPRVVGATRWDSRTYFMRARWPQWVRDLAAATATPKVQISKRVIRAANRHALVEAINTKLHKD